MWLALGGGVFHVKHAPHFQVENGWGKVFKAAEVPQHHMAGRRVLADVNRWLDAEMSGVAFELLDDSDFALVPVSIIVLAY